MSIANAQQPSNVLRTLWDVAGPRRGQVLRGSLWRLVQTMFLGLSYGVVVLVITQLEADGSLTTGQTSLAVALVLISLAGQLVFGYLSVHRSWVSSYHLVGELRERVLDHLRRLPMGFHVGRQRGDTTTALTTDMQTVENFLSMWLPSVMQALGLPVVTLVFLGIADPTLALSTAVSIVAGVPVFLWSNNRLKRLGILRQDIQAGVASRVLEYVQGIVVLRAFNQTGAKQGSFRNAVGELRDISLTMVRKLIGPLLSFAVLVQLGVPLVVGVGAYLFFGGSVTSGTFVVYLVLVLSVYAPLLGLVNVMETLRLADASLTRLARVTSTPPQPEPDHPRATDQASVRFRDVRFGYLPGQPVLRGISFDVPERSMTAVVGPSGAGKTTLLQLVARFWDVHDGSVEIGGVDVRDLSTGDLYDKLSVVFQDVYLFNATIFDNIAFGRPDATAAQVEDAARNAQAHDFIAALPDGYQTMVGEGGATLSGGERQRVSIARAILKDAPIVLLDEPTASVDATNEKLIHAALASLVADKTLLVIAHKLSTIRTADQIVVLDGGTVVEQGQHDELLAAGGRYASLWTERQRARSWRLRT
jgi:ATP-binding cassette subfamily B protein IrtB